MTVELELVKATKYCRQNSFCSVTQLKPGLQVTLNTYINVWTHGGDMDIFTFRYVSGPLWLFSSFLISLDENNSSYHLWSPKPRTRHVSVKCLKIMQRDVQGNSPIITPQRLIIILCGLVVGISIREGKLRQMCHFDSTICLICTLQTALLSSNGLSGTSVIISESPFELFTAYSKKCN